MLVVRQVAKTCRASTFRLLRDVVADLGVGASINRSEMILTFDNGSMLLHAGLDDVEKLKSIAGITSVWAEEATDIRKESDFDQIDLRLRGDVPTYRQFLSTFNPISKRHHLKRRMESISDDRKFVLHTTHRDNAFVDESYAEVLRSLPDENFRAIYERGEWGEDIKGLIYTDWDHRPTPDSPPDAYGLDFGFNHPNALIAIRLADPDLYVEEIIYETHLTTDDLIGRMIANDVRKDVPIYCDSARPDIIEALQRAGFYALLADKSVNAGINSVRRYKLHVDPASQNVVNELFSYKWGELRDGTPTDKPVKFHDDALDSLRYAVHTHLNTAGWGLW